MAERPQLFLECASLEILQEEIATNLKKGRAYVPGKYRLGPRQACELVLIHPTTGEWMPLQAEAVYVAEGEHSGVGLEIVEAIDDLS